LFIRNPKARAAGFVILVYCYLIPCGILPGKPGVGDVFFFFGFFEVDKFLSFSAAAVITFVPTL